MYDLSKNWVKIRYIISEMLPRVKENSGSEWNESWYLVWHDTQCALGVCHRDILWGAKALVFTCVISGRRSLH